MTTWKWKRILRNFRFDWHNDCRCVGKRIKFSAKIRQLSNFIAEELQKENEFKKFTTAKWSAHAIGLFSNDFKIPSKKVYWKLIKVSTQTSTSTIESALSYSRKIDQTFLLFANKYILLNVKSFKSDLSDSWICQTCPFNFCKFFAKEAQKTLIVIWIKTELEYLWGSITLSFLFVGLFYVFLFKVRRHQNINNGRVRCAW